MIDAILQEFTLLECGLATAQRYGVVKQRLQARGRPIPENDLWIAASAQEHGLAVVSDDEHFAWVEELDPVRSWRSTCVPGFPLQSLVRSLEIDVRAPGRASAHPRRGPETASGGPTWSVQPIYLGKSGLSQKSR